MITEMTMWDWAVAGFAFSAGWSMVGVTLTMVVALLK